MRYIFVYITIPTKKEAEKIAKHLLKKRLIACANIFPVGSFYWWKNEIEKSREFVLIGKTVEKNYARIAGEVEKIHSYSTPCVVKLPAEFNKNFGRWLIGEINR